jgi:hypothetical protein
MTNHDSSKPARNREEDEKSKEISEKNKKLEDRMDADDAAAENKQESDFGERSYAAPDFAKDDE